MSDTTLTTEIRLVITNDVGNVLALDYGDGLGHNLPGGPIQEGEEAKETSIRLLKEFFDLESGFLREVYRGPGGRYGFGVGFVVNAVGEPSLKFPQAHAEFHTLSDIMCGSSGLLARDIFNAAGLLNRPRLDLDKLYFISQESYKSGSNRAIEGTDLVIDEITFLNSIGKLGEIDRIISTVDVGMLHPDIADAFLVVAEGVDGLSNINEFRKEVEKRLEEIDEPLRRKFKLIGDGGVVLSEDVRADARNYYRKKAREFSQQLRDGTLANGAPGRHRGGRPIRTDLPPEWEREKPSDDELN